MPPTYSYTLDTAAVIREALELCGIISAYETTGDNEFLDQGKRSLNILLKSLNEQGKDINAAVWDSDTLTIDVAYFALDANINYVASAYVTLNGIDYHLELITSDQYAAIPNKASGGVPQKAWHDRQAGRVYFWPVPNTATYVFHHQDIYPYADLTLSTSAVLLPSAAFEMLINGLAYDIARKNYLPTDRILEFKKAFEDAAKRYNVSSSERILAITPSAMVV